jgi:hypothetical protein
MTTDIIRADTTSVAPMTTTIRGARTGILPRDTEVRIGMEGTGAMMSVAHRAVRVSRGQKRAHPKRRSSLPSS